MVGAGVSLSLRNAWEVVPCSPTVGEVNDRSNSGTGSPSSPDQGDFAESVPAILGPCDARQRFLAVTSHSVVSRLQSPPRYVPLVPVQAGTWLMASFLHVAFELSARSWVEQYSAYGVLAAHFSRLDVSLDAEPRLCRIIKLLFKSKAAAAILISLLIKTPNVRSPSNHSPCCMTKTGG